MPSTDEQVSVDALLKSLQRSGLLDEARLQAALAGTPKPLRGRAELLAEYFVRAGVLTRFQADKLLAGADRGLVLGPYHMLSPVGRGGMGAVYLARDSRNQRLVALKVLPPQKYREEERLLARFRREMEMTQKVSHPHLTRTFEAGVLQNVYFIAMEYVPGYSLPQGQRQWAAAGQSSGAHFQPGIRGAGTCPRHRLDSPRFEALQHHDYAQRPRQDPRPGFGPDRRRGPPGRQDHRRRQGLCGRHDGLHRSGASGRPDRGGRTRRPLFAGLFALLRATRPTAVSRRHVAPKDQTPFERVAGCPVGPEPHRAGVVRQDHRSTDGQAARTAASQRRGSAPAPGAWIGDEPELPMDMAADNAKPRELFDLETDKLPEGSFWETMPGTVFVQQAHSTPLRRKSSTGAKAGPSLNVVLMLIGIALGGLLLLIAAAIAVLLLPK